MYTQTVPVVHTMGRGARSKITKTLPPQIIPYVS